MSDVQLLIAVFVVGGLVGFGHPITDFDAASSKGEKVGSVEIG